MISGHESDRDIPGAVSLSRILLPLLSRVWLHIEACLSTENKFKNYVNPCLKSKMSMDSCAVQMYLQGVGYREAFQGWTD